MKTLCTDRLRYGWDAVAEQAETVYRRAVDGAW